MAKKMDMLPYSLSGKEDGYVAILLVCFPLIAWVPYQGLCSNNKEGEKENKYRETRKP